MTYDVHLFAVVRVKVTGVEAPNEMAAAKEADRLAILNSLSDNPNACTEFDDTVTHILVEPAGNGDQQILGTAKCYEPFGDDGLTEVPFDRVSTHVAVVVDGGNVQSVVTNRPCQVVVLDHAHAREPQYAVDEEMEFHDSEVDPLLRCHLAFYEKYRKVKANDRTT